MAQPEGAELEAIRTRREELRKTYLRDLGAVSYTHLTLPTILRV